MTRSHDADLQVEHEAVNHKEWNKLLWTKVIRARQRCDPTAEHGDETHYELKRTVLRDPYEW